MKVNWKRAKQEQALEVINRQEGDALTFCLALGCEFCRDLRNFGKGRLNDLIRGMYLELKDHFEKYRESEEDEFTKEEVPFLYTGLRNEVTALADVDAIEKRFAFDPKTGGWMTGLPREKRESRYTLLMDRERMFRSFWYAAMLYLWRTYGWGEDRLTRFYEFVRHSYLTVFREYLICAPAKDAWIQRQMNETVKKFTDLGVEF